MRTQKSFLDILPLHYWTGILGGVIYLVWVGITFSWPSLHYSSRSMLVDIVFTMIHLPTYLYLLISDLLTRSLNPNSWLVNMASFAGYIIPYMVFVLAGIIVGKTSNDPRREALRRQTIVVLLGIAMIVCACLASLVVFVFGDL